MDSSRAAREVAPCPVHGCTCPPLEAVSRLVKALLWAPLGPLILALVSILIGRVTGLVSMKKRMVSADIMNGRKTVDA